MPNQTNGFHILGDRGLSNENMIADIRDTGGHTHVVLNNDKLTTMIIGIGRRAFFRFKGNGAWDDDNAHSQPISATERVQVLDRMAPKGAVLYLTNEPTGNWELLKTWTMEALDECERLGRLACIFNFAVGNPTESVLELLKPVAARARRKGHVVGWHEYRNPADGNGYVPEGHYDIGRFLSGRAVWGADCPEIVITELGVTVNYVDSAGWQTVWNDAQMDEAIEAWTVFYASHGVKVCHYAYGAQGDPKWGPFEVKGAATQKSITEANQLEIPMAEPINCGQKMRDGTMTLINASSVRFRAERSTTSTQLGSFSGGETVAYWSIPVAENNDSWFKIEYQGKIGWVSATYARPTGGTLDTEEGQFPDLPNPFEIALDNLSNDQRTVIEIMARQSGERWLAYADLVKPK